jgi:hypothetical protein
MMDLTHSSEHVLLYLEPASVILLLIRLATQHLLVVYRAFTAYLSVWFLQDAVPLTLGFALGSDRYAKFFFLSEPLAWLFSCLIVLQLFELTFTDFPGIRSAGKILLSAAILAAVVVAASTAIPTLLTFGAGNHLLRLYSVLERSVMIALLILSSALLFLMVHYRLKLPRNTVIYNTGYSVYFATRALQALVMSEMGTHFSAVGNVIAMAVGIGCALFWTFTLSREGTKTEVIAGSALSEAERQRLMEQLMSVNDLVSRLRSS